MLGLRCCSGCSLVVASGGHSLAAVWAADCSGFSCRAQTLGEKLQEMLLMGAAVVASGHRFKSRGAQA